MPGVQPSQLQPAGADTLIGASAEYRVPLRGSLSGIAFMDLGWTKLNARSAASMGKGARLLEETSGLLRASAGGELRLDLPVIRQPARLIFAWNPLRLEKVFETPSEAIRMADPRRSLRFTLGSRY